MPPPRFDNRFTRSLPADPDPTNRPRQVRGACFSRVRPVVPRAPALVAWAREVVDDLGMDEADLQAWADVWAGGRVLPEMDCHAMCYGGHQFGQWAGQLGDGRAINLGEVVDRRGELQMLQLKGAGPTPYSRGADGLAVLRSSVREFLCSEAMHHLGVPTTRALSLCLTGEDVLRDMFYDGRPEYEPGAVVCRVAPSFLRFGSYELPAATGQRELLAALCDYTIRHHFPALGEPCPEVYAEWFAVVCQRTAELVVHWQRVGFVHGVLNTDNMSILGLTIDYGPYGWIDDYDPDWTPNTTDAQVRRYRFGQQGRVAQWNLAQLGNALAPLLPSVEPLQAALDDYRLRFERRYLEMMTRKLGLLRCDADRDRALIEQLVGLLTSVETDMTLFFRQLAEIPLAALARGEGEQLEAAYYVPQQLDEAALLQRREFLMAYAARAGRDAGSDEGRKLRMDSVNPRYVMRNYLAQQAIDRALEDDFDGIAELLEVMRRPYEDQPRFASYAARRPDWARNRPGCSQLSCSS